MKDTRRVLCSGSVVYDTIVRTFEEPAWGTTRFVQSIENHVGGNGANTARALGILGTPVRLLGVVGNDAAGEFAMQTLTESRVDTTKIARVAAPTAATVVLVNGRGDRQFLHRLGSSELAFINGVKFDDGFSHYHFASLFVLPHLRTRGSEILRQAKAAGFTTSLDTNWDPQGEWMEVLGPCLPHVDLLFMNEDEALQITGTCDPRQGAEAVLSKGAGAAVMKLGGHGCAIYQGGTEALCPAYEVPAIDTTGAGDSFAGGFLHARACGASWAEAGCFANAVAALSVQKVGAVAGVVSHEETLRWMESARKRVSPSE